MDIFLKRVRPQEETQTGLSGGVPEEGIVIIGEYSSMCATAPEDLTGGTRCGGGRQ